MEKASAKHHEKPTLPLLVLASRPVGAGGLEGGENLVSVARFLTMNL